MTEQGFWVVPRLEDIAAGDDSKAYFDIDEFSIAEVRFQVNQVCPEEISADVISTLYFCSVKMCREGASVGR